MRICFRDHTRIVLGINAFSMLDAPRVRRGITAKEVNLSDAAMPCGAYNAREASSKVYRIA